LFFCPARFPAPVGGSELHRSALFPEDDWAIAKTHTGGGASQPYDERPIVEALSHRLALEAGRPQR
tara:strand:- start:443 stop:640 length:198 start_codon:yes stop_codon:yes gene_type:complete